MANDNEMKIQWHPAFVAAMMLELQDNRNDLVFDDEHNLSKQPLRIDLLIIKKQPDVVVKSKLGEIFKEYNIMEYKSPHDALNIDNFHKALAYAHLFKSENDGIVNKYPSESITVSMVRHSFPREMFNILQREGFVIEDKYPGIYYIDGDRYFDIQVIVSSELSHKDGKWLKALQDKLNFEDVSQLVVDMSQNNSVENRDNIQALLDVIFSANKETVSEWKEMSGMGGALAELMAPELTAARLEGKSEGIAEGRTVGVSEGMARGDFSRAKQVIYNMLNRGFKFNDIVEIAGTSEETCKFIINMYDIDNDNNYYFKDIDMTDYIAQKSDEYDPVYKSVMYDLGDSGISSGSSSGYDFGADID